MRIKQGIAEFAGLENDGQSMPSYVINKIYKIVKEWKERKRKAEPRTRQGLRRD